MDSIPKGVRQKYVPKELSKEDKRKQISSIVRGVRRPQVKSFKSRPSKWTKKAHSYFGEGNTSKRDMAKHMAKGDKKREKQLLKGLDEIMKKGEAAYYTSGSRPNQTPESWGHARIFSVLFGGASRKVDKAIVNKYDIPLLNPNPTLTGSGEAPPPRAFYQSAVSSYEPRASGMIAGGFRLIMDTPTFDAYLNPTTQTILVASRGTEVRSKNDLTADAGLIANRLRQSTRYNQDKQAFEKLIAQYPPDAFDYYTAGHSLGGAIITQLKRDFPFIKNGVGFNPAFQTADLLYQDNSIQRKYIDGDFIYNLGGKYFNNKQVVPPKQSGNFFGWLKRQLVPTGISNHSLTNFSQLYQGSGTTGSKLIPKNERDLIDSDEEDPEEEDPEEEGEGAEAGQAEPMRNTTPNPAQEIRDRNPDFIVISPFIRNSSRFSRYLSENIESFETMVEFIADLEAFYYQDLSPAKTRDLRRIGINLDRVRSAGQNEFRNWIESMRERIADARQEFRNRRIRRKEKRGKGISFSRAKKVLTPPSETRYDIDMGGQIPPQHVERMVNTFNRTYYDEYKPHLLRAFQALLTGDDREYEDLLNIELREVDMIYEDYGINTRVITDAFTRMVSHLQRLDGTTYQDLITGNFEYRDTRGKSIQEYIDETFNSIIGDWVRMRFVVTEEGIQVPPTIPIVQPQGVVEVGVPVDFTPERFRFTARRPQGESVYSGRLGETGESIAESGAAQPEPEPAPEPPTPSPYRQDGRGKAKAKKAKKAKSNMSLEIEELTGGRKSVISSIVRKRKI